jgi:hypothetical protein
MAVFSCYTADMRTTFALLLLLASLAACNTRPMVFNGPGWYLHLPHNTIPGTDYYGGPMSYDECEETRKKEAVAHRMLCSLYLEHPKRD